jgi:hypothetical protein
LSLSLSLSLLIKIYHTRDEGRHCLTIEWSV